MFSKVQVTIQQYIIICVLQPIIVNETGAKQKIPASIRGSFCKPCSVKSVCTCVECKVCVYKSQGI